MDTRHPKYDDGKTGGQLRHDNAMKRAAQPEELAPTYVYFASEDSSFVTGAILEVTGGQVPVPK